jgi:ubiquinone/menaquinone biosynthesis C-methylase UbiE
MVGKMCIKVKQWLENNFNNESTRRAWVGQQLSSLVPGGKILDAGAGGQQYRDSCNHLDYVSQDFEAFSVDLKPSLASNHVPYKYGQTDLVCDITSIPVDDSTFDHVLCTEVLEHIPKPVDAIKELSRILKPGGTIIVTVPMNCLRHFDPYFYTSGLSDNWIKLVFEESDLILQTLEPVGDYFSWMKVEVFRTISQTRFNPLAWLLLLPALLFYGFKRATDSSVSTMCMGYHVVAIKKA